MTVASPIIEAGDGGSKQRIILEVVYGRNAQCKGLLLPGKSLVVGADVPSQFQISKDHTLSKVHFALFWKDGTCWLKDLNSMGGTQLDGEAVTEAIIPHGSWVRAGRTDFMVYHEHHTPYISDDGSDPPVDDAGVIDAKKDAIARLRGCDQPLYAVLDAARARYILILLRESVETYQSLYEGLPGESLAEVAPYLVRLTSGSTLLEKLIEYGWGHRWGIYLTSSLRFTEVRRHLRRFLMVTKHATGERMYFRFYDPPPLSVFMEVATPEQRLAFSAGIEIIPLGEPYAQLCWGGDNA